MEPPQNKIEKWGCNRSFLKSKFAIHSLYFSGMTWWKEIVLPIVHKNHDSHNWPYSWMLPHCRPKTPGTGWESCLRLLFLSVPVRALGCCSTGKAWWHMLRVSSTALQYTTEQQILYLNRMEALALSMVSILIFTCTFPNQKTLGRYVEI